MQNRLKAFGCVVFGVLFFLTSSQILLATDADFSTLYDSEYLEDFYVSAECNPGGVSDCPCTIDDVEMKFYDTYAVITSNPNLNQAYVNAIGGYSMIETYPSGVPIRQGIYKYSGKIRLPSIPTADVTRTDIPQAVHMVVFFWDGRNALLENDKVSFEGGMLWNLNPWDPNQGKIYIYTNPITPIETGLTIAPDTQWHDIEFVVDFYSFTYVSITIDGSTIDLSGIPVAQVYRPDWGNEVALLFSVESLAAWPLPGCPYTFTWSMYYKDITFSIQDEL